MKKRILPILLCLAILFNLAACSAGSGKSSDIIVLFTNDVHCGIDDNIGYDGLAAYKKDMSEQYQYVILADCGDFSQGRYEGSVTRGECIVELMNTVGYDFAILGNHEFDFGTEQLKKNIQHLNANILNCSITYTGSGENWLAQNTKPYAIKTCGKTKVAFIGVSTPWSVSSTTPAYFMENDEFVYDFCGSDGAEHFYENMQNTVDECLENGADYIVVLSHLGTDVETDTPFTSVELAQNTTGIDVVLDAHSHTEASCWVRQNKDGEDVLISSTGTKLAKIGKLVLTQDGTASVGYVDSYTKKDAAVTAKIEEVRSDFEKQMNTVVGNINTSLSCYDSDGIRMIRSREIGMGDFVADAYRIIGNADIGMSNGGGIRADLNSGDITYKDVIAVNPYGHSLCVVKVTGAEIADMLEYFCRYVQSEYKKDGAAYGEDGSFQQVSGLSFTVNTSISGSVQADEADVFIGVSGERRVSDIKVLQNGVYVPIDPDATYTLASLAYMIKEGGSGMLKFLADHELVLDEAIPDYQVLTDYITMLGGDLSQYEHADTRITIK